MAPPPLVTGVSPKEGPPGTRVTIRGENLGKDMRDLVGLKICSVDCLLSAEWQTSSKIIARTGAGKGKGDIIVTTKSGGVGTCTVGFRGFFVQIGPLQESAVWTDETQTVLNQLDRRGNTSPLASTSDEDPLGISNEGTRTKSEEEMLELFPECSGNMSLENFSPAWYLLENHQGASFEDITMGLKHMRNSARLRSEGPIAFVKTNLGAILDCFDSLETMHEKFSQDDIQRECISSYAVSLMQAKSCADGLFQDVLGRKDKADATRNALNVLQRFKFLFYLPLNIERNIKKGDYNLVINDYVRARSLFADTQVKIFQKVYKEVEEQIDGFRDMLNNKLMKLPNTLEEQKRVIKYLTHLECKGDPGWKCLVNQQEWLLSLLTECKRRHIEEIDDALTSSRNSTTNIQVPFNRGSKTSTGETGFKFKTPQKVLFVEELTEIINNNFSDFWKLGQAFISGSLTVKEEGKATKLDQTKFKEMVSSTVTYFSNLIRAAFLPQTLENLKDTKQYGEWPKSKSDISGAWLPHCVRYVRSCASSLCSLELPGDSQEKVQELALDMRTSCMFTMLEQAISDVVALYSKETWQVEIEDQVGGITQLPALFENIVNETIQHLHEVIVQNKSGEAEIFSQSMVQKKATCLCGKLLAAFAPCMELLAFPENVANVSIVDAQLRETPNKHRSSIEDDSNEDVIPSKDKKLIIMLSNCNHTRQHLIPRLVENLNKHGYLELNKVLQESQETFDRLDHKLFEQYIEEKSNPIVGAMEPNIYRGNFDWRQCKQPTGVRNYLKKVIVGMIEVHAEVNSISPAFVTRVMTKIVDAVVEEMSRIIQCVPEFGANGILQARLELLCLQDTVNLYQTENTKKSFDEALHHLPDLSQEKLRILEELINKFRSQMKFQLMCFTSDSSSGSSSLSSSKSK